MAILILFVAMLATTVTGKYGAISPAYRRLVGLNVAFSVKCHPDKPNCHQAGSSYQQPVWILHR